MLLLFLFFILYYYPAVGSSRPRSGRRGSKEGKESISASTAKESSSSSSRPKSAAKRRDEGSEALRCIASHLTSSDFTACFTGWTWYSVSFSISLFSWLPHSVSLPFFSCPLISSPPFISLFESLYLPPPPFSLHSTPSISSPLLSSPLFSFLFPSPHPSGSSVGMTRKETSGNGGDNFDVYSSRDREREREKAGAEESYPIARGLVRK